MREKKDVERVVTLYNQALRDAKLPEEIWKKIAKVNGLLLNDK